MDHELRCPYKLHGITVGAGVLEVQCDSRFCGAGNGAVVLHRFDVKDGRLIDTRKYKRPNRKE